MIQWRLVPSFPWLEASSDGRVRRCRRSADGRRKAGSEVIGTRNRNGYITLTLQQDGVRITNVGKHVLVCEAFRGPRPSAIHEVGHNDGTRHNNIENNLRWVTPKENAADRTAHGRRIIGMRHHSAKLTDSDVLEIRILKQLGFTGLGLGVMYGLNRSHIPKIVSGQSWAHLNAVEQLGSYTAVAALSLAV